jgi:hypothetical protein
MNKNEIEKFLSSVDNFYIVDAPDGEKYLSAYIGSFMSLDPCGRYHHLLSPNGITSACAEFWETLDCIARNLGFWVEFGEGDPTDVFLCKWPEND